MKNGTLYIRIDNRLLHGQVVQFWIPRLKISNLIIADDLAASTPAMVSVYRMAIPKSVKLSVVTIASLSDVINNQESKNVLIVLGDIFDLARAKMAGFNFNSLTLGNVHAAKGRNTITDSVHLTPEEIEILLKWHKAGVKIEIQTFPGDKMVMKWSQKGVEWLRQ